MADHMDGQFMPLYGRLFRTGAAQTAGKIAGIECIPGAGGVDDAGCGFEGTGGPQPCGPDHRPGRTVFQDNFGHARRDQPT